MNIAITELIDEFEYDAKLLDMLARQYQVEGQNLQYEVMWHESAVYRSCAIRLREALEEPI